MDYSIYTLASLFLIYSFLGWCAEVIFVVLDTHSFDNRGFLRGPVCPIYGLESFCRLLSESSGWHLDPAVLCFCRADNGFGIGCRHFPKKSISS